MQIDTFAVDPRENFRENGLGFPGLVVDGRDHVGTQEQSFS